MLTKNFYSLMRIALGKINSEVTSLQNAASTVPFSSSNWYGTFGLMSSYDENAYQYVRFGNGTTPATVNDYNLESPIVENISVTNPSAPTTEQTDSYISWTVTFGVLASVETTISEIGLISRVYRSNGVMTTLVDRTVLDTPVTIPAGQSKQITYTIRFNYGDAA